MEELFGAKNVRRNQNISLRKTQSSLQDWSVGLVDQLEPLVPLQLPCVQSVHWQIVELTRKNSGVADRVERQIISNITALNGPHQQFNRPSTHNLLHNT